MRQWGQRRYHPRRATPEEFLFKILGQLCSGEMGDFLTFKSLPSFPRAAAEPGQAGISSCFPDSRSLSTRLSISNAELTLSINSDSNHLSPLKMTEETQQGGFFGGSHSHMTTKENFSVIANPARTPGSPGIDRSRETGLGPRGAGEASHRGQFLRNALREMSPQFSLSLRPLFSIPQCLSRSLFDH